MHGQFPARTLPDFLSNSGDEQTVGVNEEAAEGILNTEKLQGSRHGRPAQGRPGNGRPSAGTFSAALAA